MHDCSKIVSIYSKITYPFTNSPTPMQPSSVHSLRILIGSFWPLHHPYTSLDTRGDFQWLPFKVIFALFKYICHILEQIIRVNVFNEMAITLLNLRKNNVSMV